MNPRRAPTARYVHIECNPAAKGHQPVSPATERPFSPSTAIDALYLHVPFCFHKCHYCDFYSIVEPGDRHGSFVQALTLELEAAARQYRLTPRTIFVGGGTPTLLSGDLWQRLLVAMQRTGVLARVEEFTVEANPETVTADLMRVLVAGGVNRVSMGAQSFQPALLKALERWHDPASVPRAVETVRTAGIDNVNLDLIFAIPGQTPEQLDADLDAALALEPTHLSYYGLTYEPNTALTQKLRLGRIRPIEEDAEAQMYDQILKRLAAAGFEHYEVSNWARPDRRCGHNLAYWLNKNWLGVGPSASSHLEGRRWKNQPHLGRYIAQSPQPPVVDEECLPQPQRLGEQLMLRLRLRDGVSEAWLSQHMPPDDPRWTTFAELRQQGFLEHVDDAIRLTRRGLFVADAVIAKLL